jgi:uncharacterized protein YihD (DUF1040 family)
MRDPKRIKRILSKLDKYWKKNPDWRICQLISNLHGTGPQDIFHTEDEELEEVLDKLNEKTN